MNKSKTPRLRCWIFRKKTLLVHWRAGRLDSLLHNVTGAVGLSFSGARPAVFASLSPDVSRRCEGTEYKNSSYRSNAAWRPAALETVVSTKGKEATANKWEEEDSKN
ncbi:hypothetical protein MTP99_001242 [Tenebrio molitor]|nr:hypothetical protein MTP99_001242 [Tenebrio molitor]